MDENSTTKPPETVGPYRLEEILGRGGMGEVYRAYDQRLGRRVAIKHIRPEAALKRTTHERFRREAATVAKLSHPHIVQIFDVLETEDGDWIVMEYIDGPTLTSMTAQGPIDLDLALTYGRQVAEGLSEAHEKGILHRDLKSENVMVTPSGHAKILDFGLAKRLDSESGEQTLTRGGEIMGTGRAMSPEQARGFDLDQRSDLFSFGVLLYELFTGRAPFRGRTMLDTLTQLVSAHHAPVIEVAPSVPKQLSDLVDRLLEKAPELRPHSARQVARELEEARLRHAGSSMSDGSGYAAASTYISETNISETDVSDPSPVYSRHDDLPESDAVLRTLVVSELVGSTGLFEEVGDRKALEIGKRHDALARRLLVEHNGREIDKGDGFLLLFRRPIDAVAWALDYHHDLKSLSEELGHVVETRVGIHLGEVFLRENPPADVARGAKPLEVEGLARLMAARVMSLAMGGQTLLSRGAYDLAHRAAQSDTGDLDEDTQWLRHGAYRVAGVSEAVEVFEVGSEGIAPLRAPDGERVASGSTFFGPFSAAWTETGYSKVSRDRRKLATGLVLVTLLAVSAWVLWHSVGQGRDAAVEVDTAKAKSEPPTREKIETATDLLETYDQDGHLDQAIELFEECVAAEPDSAAALAGLSRAMLRKFSFESRDQVLLSRAEVLARRAVEADSYVAEALVSLGLVLLKNGSLDEAEAILTRATGITRKDADVFIGLGKIFAQRELFEEAEDYFEKATRAEPSNRRSYDALGEFLYDRGRFQEAESVFRQSIELEPLGSVARSNLGAVLFMQGHIDPAILELQEALKIRPDPALYSNLGTLLFSQARYEESAHAFEQSLKFDVAANHHLPWMNLGDAYRWSSEASKAIPAFRTAERLLKVGLEKSPEDVKLISRLALVSAKIGNETQAAEMIRRISGSKDLGATALYRLGTASELVGDRDEALRMISQALENGYPDSDFANDPELTSLRADPRFQLALLDRPTSTP